MMLRPRQALLVHRTLAALNQYGNTLAVAPTGYKVYYYENIEGGHAGSSTNEQRARSAALEYSYLLMKLKD